MKKIISTFILFFSPALLGAETPAPAPAEAAKPDCKCTTCVCVPEKKVVKKKAKPKPKKPVYSRNFTELPPPESYPYVTQKPEPVKPEVPKPQYTLREKEPDCYKKHTINFLLGEGNGGIVTEIENDRYVFSDGNGLIGGLLYQYHWSESLNTGLGGFFFPPTQKTVFFSAGYSFDLPW